MSFNLKKSNPYGVNRNFLKMSVILVFIWFTFIKSFATTYTSVGCPTPINWSGFTAGTCPFWNGGTQLTCEPTTGDKLIIPLGCTVSINGTPLTINNAITIIVNGQLNFGNSNKLNLPAGSEIIVGSNGSFNAGNGGGNNNYIKIGGTSIWTAGVGDVVGSFILNGGCIMTGSNPNSFSPTGCGITLLPIDLLEFTGICVTSGIQLNWSTASEINNDYFLIEKSTDGYDWIQCAKIKGMINSSAITKYVHIDHMDSTQLNYYRMTQIDFNGKKTISKTIDVYCNNIDVKNQMFLYPNPSNTHLNIVLSVSKLTTNTNITLVNNAGQLIFETKVDLIKGVNSFTFLVDIPSGSYTVRFLSDSINIPAQKLMIIKS